MSATEESRHWTEVCPSICRHERLSEVRERLIQHGLNILDRADFTIGRKIGEGGQGTIYEATTSLNIRTTLAVKKFKPLEGISQGNCITRHLTNYFPNVCKPFGVFFDHDDSLCILMPRYSTDLRALIDSQVLSDGAPFSEEVAVSIITTLAISLKALHGVGIYHRDIKAANILVGPRSNTEHIYIPDIYITDFENSPHVVGTGFWRAPEALQALDVLAEQRAPLPAKQLQAADVYSFAMTCYEILTGKTPFDNHPWWDYNLVLSGGRPELPYHVPEHLKNLIHQCWHQDVDARPSFAEIVALLQESNSLARQVESVQEMVKEQGEASSKWLDASPEACLVELKRSLLSPEMLHTVAGFDTIQANAKLERVIPEFISTCEEFKSKFGWDSHLRQPSLPFVDYVERTRLLMLMKHWHELHIDGLIAMRDETKHHHDRLMDSEVFDGVFNFIFLSGHRMCLLLRIVTIISEGSAERELSVSEVAYLDKLTIVGAFIKSLVDAGVSRSTAASEVADIAARLNLLQISSIGEVRDHFLHKWYFMAIFYPLYDTVVSSVWAVCSRVFGIILLYLGYKISAVSGLSSFLFEYTRYSISGFHEVFLIYLALREGFASPLIYYILWKAWGWEAIFSSLINSVV